MKNAMLPAEAGIGSNDPDALKPKETHKKRVVSQPQHSQSVSDADTAQRKAPEIRPGTGKRFPQGI